MVCKSCNANCHWQPRSHAVMAATVATSIASASIIFSSKAWLSWKRCKAINQALAVPQADITELYRIRSTEIFSFFSFTSEKICRASCHCKPFSHTLMIELYVTTFGRTSLRRISSINSKALPHSPHEGDCSTVTNNTRYYPSDIK